MIKFIVTMALVAMSYGACTVGHAWAQDQEVKFYGFHVLFFGTLTLVCLAITYLIVG